MLRPEILRTLRSRTVYDTVIDLPELATSGGVVVGNGSAQRSTIRSLTVTFEGAVTIASGAFALVKRGSEGGSVTTTAVPALNSSGKR